MEYEFCRIYVRHLDENYVAALLPQTADGVEVEVRRSEDWTRSIGTADFVLWPTHVEVHQASGAGGGPIVAAVQMVLDAIRASGIEAVPAAEFEDELS